MFYSTEITGNRKKNKKGGYIGENYYFFDVETKETKDREHKVNFANIQDESGKINECFNDLDTMCKFMFQNKHKGCTFIAHNLGGYDGIFINNYLIRQGKTPHIIYAGSRIMELVVKKLNIRLIDS
eukprot:Lithocolla_globosa_v1_NODE_7746_length_905_cov_2.988235.p2 type:complete len:126 gc:universal NODE_7746_length_905_cov_2.988235:457-80(-)